MTGKREFGQAWRYERMPLSTCLRSVRQNVEIHLFAGSLTPRYGGPPD
ncbi:hypothetical protein [Kribbella sp. CA-293567]|nr:hypothetical protein [Kribbella sp. CA-293567]WBQ05962.1 hypothetical protein OX958_03965 [Kribbella sp. CA-293567]